MGGECSHHCAIPAPVAIGFASVYPLHSNLSGGYGYPPFEQLSPGRHSYYLFSEGADALLLIGLSFYSVIILLSSSDIDECKSAPCKNGGICENDKGTFTCKCNAGFTGHLCEKGSVNSNKKQYGCKSVTKVMLYI